MRIRTLLLHLMAATVLLGPLPAGAEGRCLTTEQQRAAIASGKAIRLEAAVKAAKRRLSGEIVNARLCEREQGLAYMLTFLSQKGKVTRVAVDAASGNVVGGG